MIHPLREVPLSDLRLRTSVKWRRYPADVLPMWIAEMDTPLAEPIDRAVRRALDLGDTGYADGGVYAEAVAEFAAARWDWTIETARTAIVPDVMMGIVEVLRLVTRPGDAVVVNPPVYPPFFQFVEHMDRRVVDAPLGADGRIDLAALERAFVDAGRRGGVAYLLCSPHNPTGAVHTRDELTAIAALATRHGVRVVVDEIHAPLVLPGATHTPYLTLPGTEDAFSLLSASKAWNLAGLRAALAVAGDAAAEDLARMPEEVSHGPSHLGVISHCAAWRDGGDFLDALLADLDANRMLLADLLAEHAPGIGYRPPEATFLAWLDCRSLGLGDDPAGAFLRTGRVALTGGLAFGTGGAGHARLNLATSPEILDDGVRRIATAVPRR